MKIEENSDDPLLSMALDVRNAQNEQTASEPSTSFLQSKSPQSENETQNHDFRKRRFSEKNNAVLSSVSQNAYKRENEVEKTSAFLNEESFGIYF